MWKGKLLKINRLEKCLPSWNGNQRKPTVLETVVIKYAYQICASLGAAAACSPFISVSSFLKYSSVRFIYSAFGAFCSWETKDNFSDIWGITTFFKSGEDNITRGDLYWNWVSLWTFDFRKLFLHSLFIQQYSLIQQKCVGYLLRARHMLEIWWSARQLLLALSFCFMGFWGLPFPKV